MWISVINKCAEENTYLLALKRLFTFSSNTSNCLLWDMCKRKVNIFILQWKSFGKLHTCCVGFFCSTVYFLTFLVKILYRTNNLAGQKFGKIVQNAVWQNSLANLHYEDALLIYCYNTTTLHGVNYAESRWCELNIVPELKDKLQLKTASPHLY